MNKLFSALLAAGLACAMVACTGDDTVGPSDGGGVTDGGARDGSPVGDGSGGDGGPGADGGDAGPCDFAAFVTDLVKNQTKDNNPGVDSDGRAQAPAGPKKRIPLDVLLN